MHQHIPVDESSTHPPPHSNRKCLATEDATFAQFLHSIETPFYVYSEARIVRNIEAFLGIPYQNKRLHFASMANDNPVLLRMLRDAGFGIFVNSIDHLQIGLAAGFSTSDIMFASTGIAPRTLRTLVERRVPVNLDSIGQLELYGQLCPGGRAGVRLNIEERSKNTVFTGAQSRIGVLEAELPALLDCARRHRLTLSGVHVYLGTDIRRYQDIVAGVERTLELADRLPDLTFVDLGGGFPIDPTVFDLSAYGAWIAEAMQRYSAKRRSSIRLVLEPGRSVFGAAGEFYTTVTDVKIRPDRVLVCCDASSSLLPRAMFYEDYNPASVAANHVRPAFDRPVDIVGSTTYSRDFLAKDLSFPVVTVGDKLVFHDAGSYCYSMITRFLGQSTPPEYMLRRDGTVDCIRAGRGCQEVSA